MERGCKSSQYEVTECRWVWAHGSHCPENPSDIPSPGRLPVRPRCRLHCRRTLCLPWISSPRGRPLSPPPGHLPPKCLAVVPPQPLSPAGGRTDEWFSFHPFLVASLSQPKGPIKFFFCPPNDHLSPRWILLNPRTQELGTRHLLLNRSCIFLSLHLFNIQKGMFLESSVIAPPVHTGPSGVASPPAEHGTACSAHTVTSPKAVWPLPGPWLFSAYELEWLLWALPEAAQRWSFK